MTGRLVPPDEAEPDQVGGGASLAVATALVTAAHDGPPCGTRFPGWIPIPGPGPGPALAPGMAW
ncbi:hypothetical protein [Paracraurococcus ruber]|nr:hypothetical protein [Paracraurococcus ruber]TDG31116.1 hypothetical protein E2C05_12040 [Paracraurococcus ruber]